MFGRLFAICDLNSNFSAKKITSPKYLSVTYVYFWLIRSFTDPAYTCSIFVCGPLQFVLILKNNYRHRWQVHKFCNIGQMKEKGKYNPQVIYDVLNFQTVARGQPCSQGLLSSSRRWKTERAPGWERS